MAALSVKRKDIGRTSREFQFDQGDFEILKELAYDRVGIALSDDKRDLVYGRLAKRLRALGLTGFREYIALLSSDHGTDEFEQFINRITTNHTSFFRENHHFTHLAQAFGPANKPSRRLRIWSAACSSGEEPYSIALTLAGANVLKQSNDVKILATDIDTSILERAQKGEYTKQALNDIPDQYHRYLKSNRSPTQVQMPNELKSIIYFKRLNLMDAWPMRGPFDVIFCRNVMIYFDAPTKQKLVSRFADLLRPGGWLYIGHSESLAGFKEKLKPLGKTIYVRTGG